MKALEIEADLLAICGNRKVSFCAAGNSGVLNFQSLGRSEAGALGILPLSKRSRDNLRQLHKGCTSFGLSLSVEVCGRMVAHVGARCKPGIFSRLLGVYPAEVRLIPILYAMFLAAMGGYESE